MCMNFMLGFYFIGLKDIGLWVIYGDVDLVG